MSAVPPDPPPRIAPLDPAAYTDETQAFFDRWTGGYFKDPEKLLIFAIFAHNPRLADLFSQFNVHLLTTSSLPVKERQIAIMRTAWITDATFMWSSHLNTSRLCGLGPEMYGPIQRGAADPYFTDFERAVIRATDELVQRHEVGEECWRALAAQWDARQMLDFLFTVGAYAMVAGVTKSIGVPRDEDLLALAQQHGAP